jgi:hypothetical protein
MTRDGDVLELYGYRWSFHGEESDPLDEGCPCSADECGYDVQPDENFWYCLETGDIVHENCPIPDLDDE